MDDTPDFKITSQQKIFAESRVLGKKHEDALRDAGYTNPDKHSSSRGGAIEKNKNVNEYIRYLHSKATSKSIAKKQEILQKLTILARSSIDDVVEMEHNTLSIKNFSDFKGNSKKKLYAIKKIAEKSTEDGKSLGIEMHDKITALKTLLAHWEKVEGISEDKSGDSEHNQKIVSDRVLEFIKNKQVVQ